MVCGITVGRKTIAGRSTSRSKKGERYRGRRRECVLLTMRVVYRPRRVLRQCLRLALYLKERISSQPESFASVSSFWFGVESPIGWVVISFVFIFFFFLFACIPCSSSLGYILFPHALSWLVFGRRRDVGCASVHSNPIHHMYRPIEDSNSRNKADSIYLMVLPVLRRIHWGMGRFCFWALASFCLVRKVLWLYISRKKRIISKPSCQGCSFMLAVYLE